MSRLLALLMVLAACTAFAEMAVQDDWCDGPGEGDPVTDWSTLFDSCESASWRAVGGQICLSSTPLDEPVETPMFPHHTCTSFGIGDLDEDGDIDLVAGSVDMEYLTILWNDGSDGWTAEPMSESFEEALWSDVSDLDGDGDLDILTVTQTPDQAIALLNTDGVGGEWELHVIDSSFTLGHSIFGSDVDADGDRDAVGASVGSSEVVVWYNNGGDPGTWPEEVVSSAAPGVRTAMPANLDDDPELEIVGALFDSDRMVWWDRDGGSWIAHSIDDSFAMPHHAFCCDVDFDGDLDVLGAAFSSGKISWWSNDGGTPITWTRTDIASSLGGALISWGGDIDGDGDMDVAASGWTSDRIMWYENLDGVGGSWQYHFVKPGFNGAWPVVTVDVDGDDCLEIVAGADVLNGPGTSHGISSFEVCEFQTTGTLTSSILDTECDPQWASCDWESVTPSGTSLSVSWRTSDDPASMGGWMEPMFSPGNLSGLLDRYVQYRLHLSADDSTLSPRVLEIRLDWDPTGIGDGEGPAFSAWSVNGTPCSISAVRIGVVFPAGVEVAHLSLFDVTGRLVAAGQATPDAPFAEFDALLPGVYHVVAECGKIVTGTKFVALR